MEEGWVPARGSFRGTIGKIWWLSFMRWRGKGRIWFWEFELGGRGRWQPGNQRAHIGERTGHGRDHGCLCNKNSCSPRYSRSRDQGGTFKRWVGWGWKRDQERQEVKGTMVPRKFTACTSQGRWQGRGWESSEHLSWPHRDKTYFQLLCEAESRHKSSPQPDILGSSQIGEFLISNEKLKHIVPIRKEMQIRKSGICVHDNRGTVFWQIWVHLYSNKYFSLWLWHFFAWDISEPYWMLLSC